MATLVVRRQKSGRAVAEEIDDAAVYVAKAAAATGRTVLTFNERMTAGALARGFAQTVLHPIDVIRTRMQAKDLTKVQWNVQTFLKGVVPQITLAVPAGAIQFAAFEYCKEALQNLMPNESARGVRELVAGAGGALAASVMRVPQEVLKQRIQAGIYVNIGEALPAVLRADGVAGLYKGYFATVSRDVPWNALSFVFHGQAKRIFSAMQDRAPTNNENLVLASLAGSLAAMIMTPIDVIKTRIMTAKTGDTMYKGIIGTFKRIVQDEGVPTLWRGVLPRILYLAPLAGITFSIYEAIAKRMLAGDSVKVAYNREVRRVPRNSRSVSFVGQPSASPLTRSMNPFPFDAPLSCKR